MKVDLFTQVRFDVRVSQRLTKDALERAIKYAKARAPKGYVLTVGVNEGLFLDDPEIQAIIDPRIDVALSPLIPPGVFSILMSGPQHHSYSEEV
jgi:hypothetical protein